jgi:hypothetical protein
MIERRVAAGSGAAPLLGPQSCLDPGGSFATVAEVGRGLRGFIVDGRDS